MATRKLRRFTEEFKADAVKLVRAGAGRRWDRWQGVWEALCFGRSCLDEGVIPDAGDEPEMPAAVGRQMGHGF